MKATVAGILLVLGMPALMAAAEEDRAPAPPARDRGPHRGNSTERRAVRQRKSIKYSLREFPGRHTYPLTAEVGRGTLESWPDGHEG